MSFGRWFVGLAVLALTAATAAAAVADNPNVAAGSSAVYRLASMPPGTPGSVNLGNPFGYFQVENRISVAGANPNDPRYATPKGAGYDGVGALYIQANDGYTYICSGALLSDMTSVLTAGHCLTDMQPGGWRALSVTPIFFPSGVPGRVILPASTTFFVNPSYTGQVIDANDVAIVRLAAAPPSGITGYNIYRGDATESQFRIVGSGRAGTGNTGLTIGPGFNQSNRRTGLNRYDFSFTDPEWGGFWDGFFGTADPDVYVSDFDNGLQANDASCILASYFGLGGPKFCDTGLGLDEVSVGGGDSGGPEFVDGLISSVTSFGLTFGTDIGDIDNQLNSTFGEFAGYTRMDFNAAWIDSVVTPEPVTVTLLVIGLAGIGGMGALRRRRGDPEA